VDLNGFESVEDVMREVAEREARHRARPAVTRVPIDVARWMRFFWREVRRPTPWRRLHWRLQRSRRGWADRDVWSMHYALARVIGEMLLYLRDRGHTYPMDLTPEAWRELLTTMAEPLLVDLDRVVEGEEYEAGVARETAERDAQVVALRLVVDRWWSLWD
jgi:hypothetical protein